MQRGDMRGEKLPADYRRRMQFGSSILWQLLWQDFLSRAYFPFCSHQVNLLLQRQYKQVALWRVSYPFGPSEQIQKNNLFRIPHLAKMEQTEAFPTGS